MFFYWFHASIHALTVFPLHHKMTLHSHRSHTSAHRFLPLCACFLVVLRQQCPTPGIGLMSLLLTGGGCRTTLGGRVKHTGSPAALISMPVIPVTYQNVHNECFLFINHLFYWNDCRMSFIFLPAKAGRTVLESFRFFTGTVGTLENETIIS